MRPDLSIASRFLFLFLISGLFVFGSTANAHAQKQGPALIDSLTSELVKAKEDTGKVNILNALSATYRKINTDEGLKYGSQALEMATRLSWKNGIANANMSLSLNYTYRSDYALALEYAFKALKIFEDAENKRGVARVCTSIGAIYFNLGNSTKALEFDLRSLKISEEIKDTHSIAVVTGNIGNVYSLQGNFPKALEYDFKALKLYEQLGDKLYAALVTGNIGIIYYEEKDYPRALEYNLRALKIDEEAGNKHGIAKAALNIGNVYSDKKVYPKALEYYFRALALFREVGDKQSTGGLSGNIGNAYVHQHNYLAAMGYFRQAFDICQAVGDRNLTAKQLYNIGAAFLSLATDTMQDEQPAGKDLFVVAIPENKAGRLHLAIKNLQNGLDTAKAIHGLVIMQDCYEKLAEAYKLTGAYRQAMECYQNYVAIRDSIFSKENEKKVIQTALEYDYGKQHLADSLKNIEKEKISALRLQRQRSYTYFGIAGAILLLVFSFVVLRNNKLLSREQARSESLLLNILPEEVASELKDTGSSAARHFDNVTVLFTDFVNFSEAGVRMSPQELIDELHICFKTFDEITARLGIEKIKTIGDAYLAVCGLPIANPQHAENMVKAAIEINSFMQDRVAKLGNKTFEIRLGINSGNVIAGIVGVKKFAYDIWGDTVNTAARMEQHSEAGKINISETTYELVKNKFDCKYRGEIDAKNKGKLKMYYVL
jgi:adenylate cyclase